MQFAYLSVLRKQRAWRSARSLHWAIISWQQSWQPSVVQAQKSLESVWILLVASCNYAALAFALRGGLWCGCKELWSEDQGRREGWTVAVEENGAKGLVWDITRELSGWEQNPVVIKRCQRNWLTCGLGGCDLWCEGRICAAVLRNELAECIKTQKSCCYGSWHSVGSGWRYCHNPAREVIGIEEWERSGHITSPVGHMNGDPGDVQDAQRYSTEWCDLVGVVKEPGFLLLLSATYALPVRNGLYLALHPANVWAIPHLFIKCTCWLKEMLLLSAAFSSHQSAGQFASHSNEGGSVQVP